MLTAETRLVGLIGDPVSHSLSPRMQNAAFAARGLDWAYVAFRVPQERLAGAVSALAALGFAGANVTIPHKTAVVAFCDDLDDVAERCGSVNTLVVADRVVRGTSTDGLAVVEALEPAGARALLLGSGGASQAVATALLDAGAVSLTVAARIAERARALAARLTALFPEREIRASDEWPPPRTDETIVVNATPIVERPIVEPTRGQQVVDLAYRPDGSATALVASARAAGCEVVVDGLEILVRQGAASFERWTGVPAPVDVMRAALRL